MPYKIRLKAGNLIEDDKNGVAFYTKPEAEVYRKYAQKILNENARIHKYKHKTKAIIVKF